MAPTLLVGHLEETQRTFLSFLFDIAMNELPRFIQDSIHHDMLFVEDIQLVDETRAEERV